MCKILVVDDDPGVRRLVETVLVRAGHQIETATSGEEAWVRFQQGGIEAIVTDWMMPHGNGAWLIERVMEEAPQTPVLILSSMEQSACVSPEWDSRGVQYLQKPFQSQRLVEMVSSLARSTDHLS